jgi:hypothetical protein
LARRGTLLSSIANPVAGLNAFLPGQAELTDEVTGEIGQCGALQQQCDRRLRTKVRANSVPDSHGHQ